jgi:hypothetical protein
MYINENMFFYSWNIQEKLNENKKMHTIGA